MTTLALILPWERLTPLYMPRRDLAADILDSLSLTVTLVESDDPGASPADLVTGPTFPEFTLNIWRTQHGYRSWDYGGYLLNSGGLLWSGTGVIDGTTPGTVDFVLPQGTMIGWPERCGWSVRVAHNAVLQDTISTGFLHLRGSRNTYLAEPDGLSGGGGGTITNDAMTAWFLSLPTSLPAIRGQPWNNGGTLAWS
jgi:hypothetical protein